MKVLWKSIVFLLLFTQSTLAENLLFERGFNQPIMEGAKSAGISLSDTAVEVVNKMGGPIEEWD